MTPPEYLGTARKWRPQRFTEVIGQDHITTTIRNALASGRVHHAYMFCGPRGVGKTTTARIIARAINCAAPVDGIEPCNQCPSCSDILVGRSMDVVEIDGASNNSVEDIRRIRENAKYPPAFGKYRVYIIDEVHMLSTSAFNALLKTLEEPPAHLLFIFATTEPHKVPATIQSRCQRFDFHRMDTRTIAAHLRTIADAEQVSIDDDALLTIARFADGSMRDAQSLFDQVRAYATGTITGTAVRRSLHVLDDEVYFALTDAIAERDLAKVFDLAAHIVAQGFDVQQAMTGLLEHLRNALTTKATGSTDFVEASEETRQRYQQLASRFSQEDLVQMMTIVAAAEQQLRYSTQPRVRFELLLAQLVHLPQARDVGKLIEELEAIRSNPNMLPQSAQGHTPNLATSDEPSQQHASTPPTTPSTPPSAGRHRPAAPVTAAEIGINWQALVEKLPPQVKSIRLILSQLSPPRIEGNRCIMDCGDADAYRLLMEKKAQLEAWLRKQLQRTIELDIVVGQSTPATAPPVSAEQPTTPHSEDPSPIERALLSLGARPIPSTQ